MQSAPPVSYPAGRSVLYGWLLSLVWVSALVVMLSWSGLADDLSWRWTLCWCVLVLTGVMAVWSWLQTSIGQLWWTGHAWLWVTPDGQQMQGQLHLRLDWQRGMLVRFEPADSPGHWAWVERHRRPDGWLDLRRALHATAGMTLTPDLGGMRAEVASHHD